MCLLEGSSVIFTCVFEGFPHPEIIFRKESVPIMPGVDPRVERVSMDQVCIILVLRQVAISSGISYNSRSASGTSMPAIKRSTHVKLGLREVVKPSSSPPHLDSSYSAVSDSVQYV